VNQVGSAYQWKLDGTDIAGATGATHVPLSSGVYICVVDGKVSSPVTITILPGPTASITATPNPVDLAVDPTGTITFANTSAPNGDTFWWDFDNGFSTSQENPAFPFTTVGPYDVWFWVEDSGNGCLDSVMVTVTVISSVGISELETAFEVYPNPVTDFINIYNKQNEGVYTAQLLDMNGKIVAEKILNNGTNNQIDLEGVENGIYLIKVFNSDSEVFYKVIKE
jgi:PKD repeat protein